jgi:hypothetical protein
LDPFEGSSKMDNQLLNNIIGKSIDLNEQISVNGVSGQAEIALGTKKLLEKIASEIGLTASRTSQYLSFIMERYTPGTYEPAMAREWASRFKNNNEWDFADERGQSILEGLFPELYKKVETKESYKEEIHPIPPEALTKDAKVRRINKKDEEEQADKARYESLQTMQESTDIEDMRKRILELSEMDGSLLSDIYRTYISEDVPGELDETKAKVKSFLADSASEEQLKEIWAKFVHYGTEFDEKRRRCSMHKSGKKVADQVEEDGDELEDNSGDWTQEDESKVNEEEDKTSSKEQELQAASGMVADLTADIQRAVRYVRAGNDKSALSSIKLVMEDLKSALTILKTLSNSIKITKDTSEDVLDIKEAFSTIQEQDEIPVKRTKKKPWEEEDDIPPEPTPGEVEGEEEVEVEEPVGEVEEPVGEVEVPVEGERVGQEPISTPEPDRDTKLATPAQQEKSQIEKEYLGRKDDDFYYITQSTSDTGEATDLIVQNQVGEKIFSAVENDLDPGDVKDFIISAARELDIPEVSTTLVDKWIVPEIDQEAREEEIDIQKEEPFELGSEELGRKKEEGIVPYQGKPFSYSLYENNNNFVLEIGGKSFYFTKGFVGLYETVEQFCLDVLCSLEKSVVGSLKEYQKECTLTIPWKNLPSLPVKELREKMEQELTKAINESDLDEALVDPIKEIAKQFVSAKTVEELDSTVDKLFNYADTNNIQIMLK